MNHHHRDRFACVGNIHLFFVIVFISVTVLSAQSVFSAFEFTPPATLNTNADTNLGTDEYPQVTTDGLGNWVAVWHSTENHGGTAGTYYDLFFTRSIDNGVTWSAPATLNTNADTDSGFDAYPQITTDRQGNWITIWDSTDTLGKWVVVWFSAENLGGTIGSGDWDIFVALSTDNGVTWTDPDTLNSNAETDANEAYDLNPYIATDGSGNWVTVWYSEDDMEGTIGTDPDILVSTSGFSAVLNWE